MTEPQPFVMGSIAVTGLTVAASGGPAVWLSVGLGAAVVLAGYGLYRRLSRG